MRGLEPGVQAALLEIIKRTSALDARVNHRLESEDVHDDSDGALLILWHRVPQRWRLDPVVCGRRSQTFDSARAFARAFLSNARRTSSMES
jgi:hypothetical protein